MTGAETLFWSAAGLLVYTYAGYPFLLWVRAGLKPRGVLRNGEANGSVSILVVAHNEAGFIRSKIENLLALDYPARQLEIILGSDGSTDETVSHAEQCRKAGIRVKIVPFGRRRGKPAVLNDLVQKASGRYLVFTDTHQLFEQDSVRRLIAPFADPRVGAVGGELLLAAPGKDGTAAEGVGFYWRYEKFIRRQESRIDSMVGVSGAIYAVRRELYESVPEDTVLDDVLLPMRIVRRGYRVVFEPGARAHEQRGVTAATEFARKVRTIAGNFQLFMRHPWLLNPFSNRIWVQTVSHKLCRLLGPACLAGAFAANLALLGAPLYDALMALQILFYGAAAGGVLMRGRAGNTPFINVPYAFCLLNWATVTALYRVAAGRQAVTWDKAREKSFQ